MKKQADNLETFFKNAFDQHSEMPSPHVLKQLKRRLWISDFFSFKSGKPNIFYVAFLIAAIITGILLLDMNKLNLKNTAKNKKSPGNEQPEKLNENQFPLQHKNNKEPDGSMESKMFSAHFNASHTNGCAPLFVDFRSNHYKGINYYWDFGNGDSSDKPDPSCTYTQPGTYIVKLTISDNQGNNNIHTQQIEVFQNPVVSGAIDVDNSDIASRKIRFVSKSKGTASYLWNFGDGKTSEDVNPVHTYEDYGNYNVLLIATAGNGCADTFELENTFLKYNYQLNFPYTFKPNTTDKGNNGFYESNASQGGVFYPKNYGVKEYHLSIKAPNGIEIFSSDNIKQGWNGYIRGRIAPGGVYSYRAKGVYPNGKPFQIEGNVKVIIEDYFQD
jgi:PKD repeat protein